MTSNTSLHGSFMSYDISTNPWYTGLIDKIPEGDPKRREYLTELSTLFERRYRETGNLQDLETAIQKIEEALCFSPAPADREPQSVASLANQHRSVSQDLKEIEPAEKTARDAVNPIGADHSHRPARLERLSQILNYRYMIFKDPNDLARSIQSSQEAIDLSPLDDYLRAARLQHLAWCFQFKYREEGKDPKDLQAMHQLYGASFQTQAPLQNRENSWEAALSWAKFSLEFQDIHLHDAYLAAFRLLPDILWIGHRTHLREDTIRKLGLADATSRATRACIWASDIPTAIELLEQGIGTIFQQILQVKPDQRELPPAHAKKFQSGLEDFLCPKPYKALAPASQGGPVIILSSNTDGSDVFIILNPTSEPVHLAFPNMSSHELTAQRKLLLDVLGRCNVRRREDSTSARLIAHREGYISKPTDQCFAELLDWLWLNVFKPVYVALKSPSNSPAMLSVVGVTHTDPGGINRLKGVSQEVRKIRSVVSNLRCLEGERATPEAVQRQLQNYSWAHLACHGKQDLSTPSSSHLLLYGGNLALHEILKMPLPNAQSVDSLLLAFVGPLGLWSMNDADGPLVAESVYSQLLKKGRQPQASDVAKALHIAVQKLKAMNVPYERWIPYIHMDQSAVRLGAKSATQTGSGRTASKYLNLAPHGTTQWAPRRAKRHSVGQAASVEEGLPGSPPCYRIVEN
ncbi:hypothetical protein B0H19DRAFT_1229295 [Mycena capillaripes]|nr:hypothetical protein B0H19DRAFT_1229295 [Mycena capillaripes]